MAKYHKYTGGQIEAVLNMIGGEPVMDALLHHEVELVVVTKTISPTQVKCEVVNACHCSICGGPFADGETICVNRHEIGQMYNRK